MFTLTEERGKKGAKRSGGQLTFGMAALTTSKADAVTPRFNNREEKLQGRK